MMTYSEKEILEIYNIGLNNLGMLPEAREILALYGYDSEKLALGKQIFQSTYDAFKDDKRGEIPSSPNASLFHSIKEELNTNFLLHRKRAKIIFSQNPVVRNILLLDVNVPNAFYLWVEQISKFYYGISSNGMIMSQYDKFELSEDDVKVALEQIELLKSIRSEYLNEIGESLVTAESKDMAFAMFDSWMSNLNKIIKYVFYNKPELIEAIYKPLKN